MRDLKGKVAYITGGSKGIGFAIAQSLVDAGMKVAISGRNLQTVKTAARQLGNGDDVLAIASDVTQFAEEEQAVKVILDKWGTLDVVLANAGVGIFTPVDEMTPEQWHTMIDTNLNGVFHTLKAAVEPLKATKGYYITIASLAGANFFASGAGYNATKFGVVGFTQAAMLDLRKYEGFHHYARFGFHPF